MPRKTEDGEPETATGAETPGRRTNDTQRYTVDLNRDQRRILAVSAAEWEVDKSKIIRILLYLLEADESLRTRVEREIFDDEPEGKTS